MIEELLFHHYMPPSAKAIVLPPFGVPMVILALGMAPEWIAGTAAMNCKLRIANCGLSSETQRHATSSGSRRSKTRRGERPRQGKAETGATI